MMKPILAAATLALWLAGPAAADSDPRRGKPAAVERESAKDHRPKVSAKEVAAKVTHSKQATKPSTFTVRPDYRDRGHDSDRHRDRDHDRRDDRRDWRDHDRDRDHDWRRNDWRRDDDWRRRGWHYSGGRNDGWRYYRGHDHRHWRYVPPVRYGVDFGYRSGYERAWRDWLDHGRHNRHWRRSSFFGFGYGSTWRSGYEAGWRDAGHYYGLGYRPDYWSNDPYGGWYFSFRIVG